MIELDEELELFRFLEIERTVLLLGQKFRYTLLRRWRWLEGSELFHPCGIGNEFDDFLKWFHGRKVEN